MGFIVKNTTLESPLNLICPHTCRGCGALGKSFCDCCKNDIIVEHENYCPNCKTLILNGKCQNCWLPPSYMVGWRDEKIGQLVHDYKYHSVRALASDLAELLDAVLPCIDGEVTIVPLPTVDKHIRERGFDHILKLAKKLARRRGYSVRQLLTREKNTVQVGANMEARMVQAATAYGFCGEVDPQTTYLLIDDVWTTGSTMRAAIKKLQQAGASKIILAVLAVNRAGVDN